MRETLALFDDVVDLPSAAGKPLVLILNERDLLQERLGSKRSQEASFFPDYRGAPDDVSAHIDFMKTNFPKRGRAHHRPLFTHTQVVLETDNVALIWTDIRHSIVSELV